MDPKKIIMFSILAIIIPSCTLPIFAETHQGGSVIPGLNEDSSATIIVGPPSEKETTVLGMSMDGKTRVEITASNPIANEKMTIKIKFRDSNSGGLIQHANFDIVAIQNGNGILSNMGVHEHTGEKTFNTVSLPSGDPVDITVTLLGFGLPDDKPNWKGSTGEVLYFNVVPEFGTIALLILVVGMVSIITISSKLKFGQLIPYNHT